MDEIYIIDDKINVDIQKLIYPKIDYSKKREASDFHEYVINLFKLYPTIQKLIIPINLGEMNGGKLDGLTLGLHIRLNNEIGEKKLIPLIFIGEEDLEELLLLTKNNLNNPVYLLATKGCIYCNNFSNLDGFLKYETGVKVYEKDVLNHLKLIQPEEDGGKHSLANIWGAIRLNEVLNLNAINDKSLTNRTKELYFKYLRAFHEESKGSFKDLQPLQCTGKRILMIDDEADKGWNDVLKAIFKGADFQSIDFKNKTFEVAEQEAISKSISEDWDLILLDLRLNPSKEDTGDKLIKTEEYSGARILKAIKDDHNAGIQVIMLTASNKAWNMKKLLDLGADGYYIKESPEFNFSEEFTSESFNNFAKECNNCFEKYYLRKIFKIDKAIQKKLDLENGILGNHTLGRGTVNLIKAYLKQAFNAIYEYSQTQKEYALYSFLEYYKIVELLGKELIIENPTKFFVKRRSDIDFIIKSPLLSKIEPVKEFSNTGKYFIKGYKKNDYIPITDDEGFYKKPTSSLRFSGLMLLRLGFDETSVGNFMLLNNLRNTVVAHSADNSTTEIKVENVIALLEILEKSFQKL